MFTCTNHANFLANPYASLKELRDIKDFKNDIGDDDKIDGDMNLESTQ